MKGNKYKRWYLKLMAKAKGREELKGYVEKHHIIPKCFGGSNSEKNIATLTYREHFLAHWLLTKFYVGVKRRSMLCAFSMMSCRISGRGHRIASWQYALIRKAGVDAGRGKIMSKASIRKIRLANLGSKRSIEVRKRMSIARIGNQNRKGIKHSKEAKAKIGKAITRYYKYRSHSTKGKRLSPERRAALSLAIRNAYDFGGLRKKRIKQAKSSKRGKDGRWT